MTQLLFIRLLLSQYIVHIEHYHLVLMDSVLIFHYTLDLIDQCLYLHVLKYF